MAAMIDAIEIKPASGPVSGRMRPPGSKSITNRALICAALADGSSTLRGALDSEDTAVMIQAIQRLGIVIEQQSAASLLHVRGSKGEIPAKEAELYIANSGTSIRFLTASLSLGQGRFRLDGTPRMRERPIQDLLDGLAQLGVRAQSELNNGCPPIVVHAAGLPGGTAKIRGDISSQFLSGLLMVAPYAARPVDLFVDGPLVSQPYVRLTLAVMRAFGIMVPSQDLAHLAIPRGHYQGCIYEIEPDATAASYFLAAAAIIGGDATIDGLSHDSFQGDVEFCDCLAQMGCQVIGDSKSITVSRSSSDKPLRGINVDMNAISDTVQTLAAVALFADGPTTITGVAHIRHKETDRIGNLATELRKLGAMVDELPDGLRITPGPLRGARIETYRDHRMAMSLSLVGLRVPGVVILDPNCTEKTYPRFFDDLKTLVERTS
jgi:3-phosphoshikimate 1-carboxyvinyltransferase